MLKVQFRAKQRQGNGFSMVACLCQTESPQFLAAPGYQTYLIPDASIPLSLHEVGTKTRPQSKPRVGFERQKAGIRDGFMSPANLRCFFFVVAFESEALCSTHYAQFKIFGGFPKLGVPFWGVPMIRTIVLCGSIFGFPDFGTPFEL